MPKPKCECTSYCGDDPRVATRQVTPCETKQREREARLAQTRTTELLAKAGHEGNIVAALEDLLATRAALDAAYLERNQVVAALARCFPAGIAQTPIEGWAPEWWGCVYIDLPTGQASWHFHTREAHLFAGLPPYAGKWDGHTTPEKYARLARLADTALDSSVSAAIMVLAERRRQVEVEGWTPEHDDEHADGSMALAAGCYAMHHDDPGLKGAPAWWPWHAGWWKPADPLRNLIKAGALILAEIERRARRERHHGIGESSPPVQPTGGA